MGLAAASAIAAIVASAATTATTIAGTVQSQKAEKRSLSLQEKQADDEKRARQREMQRSALLAKAGSQGTILAPQGLGGVSAASVGKSSLLGGP
jgi:hypothetical protein